MPIYEYERADGSRFEIRQSFHDDALTTCPDTGQPVRRIVSPAPIIFKGSGWYITDSRPAAASDSASTGTASSAATTSSSTDSATTSGETKSTESKPTASTGTETSTKKGGEAAA